ncbi:DMT family transporter [Chromobacterium sp. IIBBL 290-4]|uniref:DMT family transporter n=1 Tax=Chromobacterium sp. IIBBL 290-4 TaxID=2953890 RepID=UPI0020B6AFB6|nr:EamA family transporter [Chromobacterium sp. IIBBL 290-4]UTH75557.1 EamA family transporter [Chromobacterium sp. IIBBL 290-4]
MNRTHTLITILLATSIFGFNYVAAKISSIKIDPVDTAMLRVAFAALPACLILRVERKEWAHVLLYGVAFSFGLFLFFKGLKTGADAGISSVIMQAGSLFTAVAGIIFFKEKWNQFNILGCAIAMLGIYSISKIQGGGINLAGIAFVLASAFSWTFANLAVRHSRTKRPVAFVAWGSLVSALLLAATHLIDGAPLAAVLEKIDQRAWLAIAFQGYITTLVGYGLWTLLLSRNQLVLSAPSYLLVPAFALLFSHIILNETITIQKVLFSCIVVIGVTINSCAHQVGAWINLRKKSTILSQ